MVRSEQSQLTPDASTLRSALLTVIRAAIDGASASTALARALQRPELQHILARPLHVIAAGKAAGRMAADIAGYARLDTRRILAIGTHRAPGMPAHVEWHPAAHPVPDARSVAAGERALQIAAAVDEREVLMLLLSGGASALMAAPAGGLSLAAKQQTIQTMLLAGADIDALNTVRKHLSRVKGGRLARACRGTAVTLAVSDVIGDDLSVIGSGPGVPDATTWRDAVAALDRYGGAQHHPDVRAHVARGLGGEVPDTPKPGDPALARMQAIVIASQRDALEGARRAAEALGYDVVLIEEPVRGEARTAAQDWFGRATAMVANARRPTCILSAGETTVHVKGSGRGGRNQEFALALVDAVAASRRVVIASSVGTDGIDGPTDAAGALVDGTTRARATALGLDAASLLADNNSYDYFAMLGDLIHVGRTDTNVGDVQVLMYVPAAH